MTAKRPLHGQGGGSKFAAVRRRLCQAACKRVLDALPKPEVMLPRAVGNVSWGIMRLDRTVERMPQLAQAKRPATVYLKRFYCDCIIESPEIVTDLIRLVGAERVLFGTDYPSSMRDTRPIEFIQNLAEVSPADRAAILGSNAARAFKL